MQIFNIIMQFMKRKFIIAVLYLALIIALIVVKAEYSHLLMKDCNYGMEALIQKGEVEHLFVGSSTFRQGLDINVLEENLGDGCYILAYNGNQPCTEYLQIKKLLDNGVKIENLYIDMYAFTFCREPGLDDEKLLMELNIKEKWELYKLLPNKSISLFWQVFVSSNNEQLLTWPVNKPIINTMFRKGGTLLRSEGMSEEAYDSINPIGANKIQDDTQVDAVKGIIELCNNNNINLLFIETPKAEKIIISDVYVQIMRNYVELLSVNNTEMVLYDYEYLEYNDFTDGLHLSTLGRRRFTESLLFDIKDNNIWMKNRCVQ